MTDVKLDHPGGQLSMPVRRRSRVRGIEVSRCSRRPASSPWTGLREHGLVRVGDHVHRRRRGHPALSRLPDRAARREGPRSSRSSYLLIHDELPTPAQLAEFADKIRVHTLLQEDMRSFFAGFPRDAHPMAVLSSAVSALSTFYQDASTRSISEQVEISTIRLMAKLPTIAAYAYKKSSASRCRTRTTRWTTSRTSCA